MYSHSYLMILKIFTIAKLTLPTIMTYSAGLGRVNDNTIANTNTTNPLPHFNHCAYAFMPDNSALVGKDFTFNDIQVGPANTRTINLNLYLSIRLNVRLFHFH
ncbi:hypothetical protein D3C78_1564510 [compost metagenome]